MLKNEVKSHLEQVIIPFWSKLVDSEYGGFYGLVDADLKVHKKFTKGVILNSRILWFFSNAYLTLKDSDCLNHATHAYKFLKNYCVDRENGGVYWSMKYNGEVEDSTKHTYNVAFAIYALSSYYTASKDSQALQLAADLYDVMEHKCKDDEGYLESFTKEFQEESNEKLSENGIIAKRTMNTILHVLEAYTEFYSVTGRDDVKQNLCWILDEVEQKVYNRRKRRLDVFFDKDMNSLLNLQSFGHDIEAAWLIDRACEKLGDEGYTKKMTVITRALTQSVYEAAYHKYSVWNECENQTPDKTRVWWVQAEAMVGFINGFQADSSKVKYKYAAKEIWNYIKTNLVDKRKDSEWFWQVNDHGVLEKQRLSAKDEESLGVALGNIKGKEILKPIVEPWKCPYHNGRMCMELIRRNFEDE